LLTYRGNFRLVERMQFNFFPESPNDFTNMVHLDSASRANSDPPKTDWPEFTGYAGETVTVLADGVKVLENYSVPSSGVELPEESPATEVVIGYQYTPRLRTLPYSITLVAGNSGHQSRLGRVTRAFARVENTLGMAFGDDPDDAENFIEEDFGNNDDIENDTDLYTGDLKLSFHQTRNRELQFYIEQREPYPLNLLSLTIQAEIS